MKEDQRGKIKTYGHPLEFQERLFYFAPSNLPLNWLADGLMKIRKSTVWKSDSRLRRRDCHHVSLG
jgi:hypothetical protein